MLPCYCFGYCLPKLVHVILVNFIFELHKLELVNGVIFTGGWAKTGLYYDVVEKIFNVSSHYANTLCCFHVLAELYNVIVF